MLILTGYSAGGHGGDDISLKTGTSADGNPGSLRLESGTAVPPPALSRSLPGRERRRLGGREHLRVDQLGLKGSVNHDRKSKSLRERWLTKEPKPVQAANSVPAPEVKVSADTTDYLNLKLCSKG